ncbi:hypothetical protein ACFL7D_10850 [candidate division KSB1 bacterium]
MTYFLITFAVLVILYFIRYFKRDYIAYFKRTSGKITENRTKVISSENGIKIEQFELVCSRGFTLNGYFRIPEIPDRKLPVIIVLGGLFTGKGVIDLLEDMPGYEPVVNVSIDYPFTGEKRLKWWQVLLYLPKIRRAIMDSVRGVLLLIEYISKRKEFDKDRIHLIGASLGAFFGIAAAACDKRIKSVSSLFGGGKIEKLITKNLPYKFLGIHYLAGYLAKIIAFPLEPLNYIKQLSPRPLLVIGGKGDEKFPIECAQVLYEEALEPKDLIWFTSKHPEPEKNQLLLELTSEVAEWMTDKKLIANNGD